MRTAAATLLRGGQGRSFASRVDPFLSALPQECHCRIPKPMLDFHTTGGYCTGRLVRERGAHPLANLVATLGRLPPPTPPGERPSVVTVRSEVRDDTGDVHWHRFFPPSTDLESRWTWSGERQLAVDSFTYLGIRDFAAFGFRLDPVSAEEFWRERGDERATEANTYMGFRHITEAAWIMGIPIPLSLALIADGTSVPHSDGNGWYVEVEVQHSVLGKVVSYIGDVRLENEEKEDDDGCNPSDLQFTGESKKS